MIEKIKRTRWWQKIRKYDEKSQSLLYDENNVIDSLKMQCKCLCLIIPVAVPVIMIAIGFAWLVVNYLFPILLIFAFIFFEMIERKKSHLELYQTPYSEEIWETLAVRVVKAVTKEPVDCMDVNGKYNFYENAYIFTLMEEIDSDVQIETIRQRICKKLSHVTNSPVEEIRKNNIVTFNGKTIKIRAF